MDIPEEFVGPNLRVDWSFLIEEGDEQARLRPQFVERYYPEAFEKWKTAHHSARLMIETAVMGRALRDIFPHEVLPNEDASTDEQIKFIGENCHHPWVVWTKNQKLCFLFSNLTDATYFKLAHG